MKTFTLSLIVQLFSLVIFSVILAVWAGNFDAYQKGLVFWGIFGAPVLLLSSFFHALILKDKNEKI